MPLVQCPECSHAVSDRAFDCPKCGFPINDRRPLEDPLQQLAALQQQRNLNYATPGRLPPVQTIEFTSKALKGQVLLAAMVIIISGIVYFTAPEFDVKMIAAAVGGFGAIWLIVVRITIWWNHG